MDDFPIVESVSSFFRVCSGEIIGNNFFAILPSPFFLRRVNWILIPDVMKYGIGIDV